MYINGINISKYNAVLLDRKIYPTEIIKDIFVPDLNPGGVVVGESIGRKKLYFSLEFFGTKSEIQNNKSKVINDLRGEGLKEVVVKFSKIKDKVFTGYITNSNIGEDNYLYESLEVSMLVYEEGKEIVLPINGDSLTFNIGGTLSTPLVIQVYPTQESITLVVNEVTVKINKLLVGELMEYNSRSKRIFQSGDYSGKNLMEYAEFTKNPFGKLWPGTYNFIHTVGVSTGVVCYSERWL